MKRLAFTAAAMAAMIGVSHAQEPPTVALTQDELETLSNAQIAQAFAQAEAQKAAAVLQKMREAFAPKADEKLAPKGK